MKNKKIYLTLFTIFILITLSFCWTFADVGNSFSGSSSGGSFSSGSSGGSFSSGSSGGDSGGFSFYIYTGDPTTDLIVNGIAYTVIIGVAFARHYYKNNHSNYQSGMTRTSYFSPEIEREVIGYLIDRDSSFSARNFKSYVQEVFIQIQEAWESRDMSIVRPLETDELFNRHQQQLQEYIQKDWYPHLDGQCINAVYLADIYHEADFEFLVVRLEASVIDFTTDSSGCVVQGNKTTYQHRAYRLTFKRHLSALTQSEQTLSTKSCPNCGAPTSIGAAGECEFCGSIVTTGEHNWVLENYEAWR